MLDSIIVAKLLDENHRIVDVVRLVVPRLAVGTSINNHVRHVVSPCPAHQYGLVQQGVAAGSGATSIPRLVANHHPLIDLSQIRAVTEAGYRGDVSVIVEGLEHINARVRAAAAGAASRRGLLDVPIFLRLRGDTSPLVRRRTIELAARHQWSDSEIDALLPALVSALADVWMVAEMSAFALGELEVASAEVVAPLEAMAARHSDPLCREAAVAALGALGAGRATILAALDDRAAVRRRAVLALAPFEGEDVDAALQRALSDRDWQVRQAAEDLLAPPVSDDRDWS